MLQYPPDPSTIRILTLAQLCPLGSWQLSLAHDRPHSLLIWMTRGQGVAMFDGRRHGLGAHNALFVPARQLISLDVGRQGYGQAILLPLGIEMTMPEGPRHIRARDVSAQTELTALFEAMSREQNAERPLWHSSMDSYGQLAMIWLRRQLAESAPHAGPETAEAAGWASESNCGGAEAAGWSAPGVNIASRDLQSKVPNVVSEGIPLH